MDASALLECLETIQFVSFKLLLVQGIQRSKWHSRGKGVQTEKYTEKRHLRRAEAFGRGEAQGKF